MVQNDRVANVPMCQIQGIHTMPHIEAQYKLAYIGVEIYGWVSY